MSRLTDFFKTGGQLYPLPGNTYVTGDMYGLEYSYTSANSITVDAGICYDSLNTTLLTGSASQVVSIGTTINQIYNLFLCDDGLVKTDTDVEGTTLLAGAVNQLRWIGFVLTNSSGAVITFNQSGNMMMLTTKTVVGIATSTVSRIGLASFAPISRMNSVEVYMPGRDGGAVITDKAGVAGKYLAMSYGVLGKDDGSSVGVVGAFFWVLVSASVAEVRINTYNMKR